MEKIAHDILHRQEYKEKYKNPEFYVNSKEDPHLTFFRTC